MTRDECIKVLQALWRYKDCGYSEYEIRESLEMAIKVLEQEPCEDCVSRKEFLDILSHYVTQETRWIPVSESLPKERFCDDGWVEPSDTVLIQFNNGEMTTSSYWGSNPRHKDEPWMDIDYPTTLEVVWEYTGHAMGGRSMTPLVCPTAALVSLTKAAPSSSLFGSRLTSRLTWKSCPRCTLTA